MPETLTPRARPATTNPCTTAPPSSPRRFSRSALRRRRLLLPPLPPPRGAPPPRLCGPIFADPEQHHHQQQLQHQAGLAGGAVWPDQPECHLGALGQLHGRSAKATGGRCLYRASADPGAGAGPGGPLDICTLCRVLHCDVNAHLNSGWIEETPRFTAIRVTGAARKAEGNGRRWQCLHVGVWGPSHRGFGGGREADEQGRNTLMVTIPGEALSALGTQARKARRTRGDGVAGHRLPFGAAIVIAWSRALPMRCRSAAMVSPWASMTSSCLATAWYGCEPHDPLFAGLRRGVA